LRRWLLCSPISLVFIAPALLPTAGSTGTHVSRLVYPAAFLRGIDGPAGIHGARRCVTVGDDTFVPENNRIFRLRPDGDARDGGTRPTANTPTCRWRSTRTASSCSANCSARAAGADLAGKVKDDARRWRAAGGGGWWHRRHPRRR
jgi:hypothetical protein